MSKRLEQRYTQKQAQQDARRIYLQEFSGELATLMASDEKMWAGYPFVSVVPFCLDRQGRALFYLATIAEHTKNIVQDKRVTLFLRASKRGEAVNRSWRLTYMGKVQRVPEAELSEAMARYFRHFPRSERYDLAHFFHLYRFMPIRCRLIMGFGKIAWVDFSEMFAPSPFTLEEEAMMMGHMNAEHVPHLAKYLLEMGVRVVPELTPPQMVAVNQYGITILYCRQLYFVSFAKEARSVSAVRAQLVAWAQKKVDEWGGCE